MASLPVTVRLRGTAAIVVMLLAACGDAESAPDALESNTTLAAASPTTTPPVDGSATSTTSPSSTEPAATTTTATTTTVAPTTAAPTTTSPPLTVADLVLRSDGIGPIAFGTTAQATLDALTPLLGAPVTDESTDYPNQPNPGWYESADGDFGFDHPFERHVCFANGWCPTFGGPSAAELALVGWVYSTGGEPALATADGVTIGSRWADFAEVMDVGEGGCYMQGYGTTADMRMTLEASDGEMFAGWDDAGNYVILSPDPALVTVTALEAGQLRVFLFGDC